VSGVEPGKQIGRCRLGDAGTVGGEFFVAERVASRARGAPAENAALLLKIPAVGTSVSALSLMLSNVAACTSAGRLPVAGCGPEARTSTRRRDALRSSYLSAR
jgi:hypothetical protein